MKPIVEDPAPYPVKRGDATPAPDTPMMRQYLAAKARYPHHLLFFRLGDFYELFFEDAKTAARVLGLTLTSRAKGPDAVPMAGVPVHMADVYLARLLRQGFCVVVCDQMEDPALAKGLVKRDITRVVTPGTVVEEDLLDARKPNRLVAVCPRGAYSGASGEWSRGGAEKPGGETSPAAGSPASSAAPPPAFGVASVDLSHGALFVQELADAPALAAELARLAPSECLVPEPEPLPPGTRPVPVLPPACRGAFALSPLKREVFAPREAHARLLARFGKSALETAALKALCARQPLALAAAGALLGYLEETHGGACAHLRPPQARDPEACLELDQTALRGLELVETLQGRTFEGSLLWTLDRTRTGAGARRLREWLLRPLRRLDELRVRQEAVATLHGDARLRAELRELLAEAADLERIAARLAAGRAAPRDLISLKDSLLLLPRFAALLEGVSGQVLAGLRAQWAGLDPVAQRIASTLRDDVPNTPAEGGVIREGVHPELDRLRSVATGGKQWIAAFQAEEARRTGIAGLKVGYNRVFGYYIEISKAHQRQAPADYERRQTLANAERFVTPALKEHEAEVLGAEDKAHVLEVQLFQALRDEVAGHAPALRAAGSALASLDALASLAEVAARKGYVRPEIAESPRLIFRQLRHPVLEETLPPGTVVPNDLELCAGPAPRRASTAGAAEEPPPRPPEAAQVLLLTGPNMAGKSTYIRSAALATILAQMGAFVPAEHAEVGLVDRIFTRVGAGDDLAGGRSTFMVEMAEVAEILAHATSRSLVILDEVGRGTSTYDGVSLAWALIEHLHEGPARPRTLFATHYHELSALAEELPRVRNASAVVKEWQGEITFLYRIVAGPSERSFGLHVARLAGLPAALIDRARAVLSELEMEAQERVAHVTPGAAKAGAPAATGPRQGHIRLTPAREEGQMLLFEPTSAELEPRVYELLRELRALDPEALTPLEALAKLNILVRRAKGSE